MKQNKEYKMTRIKHGDCVIQVMRYNDGSITVGILDNSKTKIVVCDMTYHKELDFVTQAVFNTKSVKRTTFEGIKVDDICLEREVFK